MLRSPVILILFLLLSVASLLPQSSIRNRINDVLQSVPASTNYGIFILNPLTADTIFEYNSHTPFIPASNTKVFTTAAALFILGDSFTFQTALYCKDANLNDGVINSDLYIKGFGNSLFTREDMQQLARNLASKGIRQVNGRIYGDDSYFDDVYRRSDWIEDETDANRLPPISALVVDYNQTTETYKKRRRVLTRTVSVQNPPLHAARLLRDYLLNEGITVDHVVDIGITPPDYSKLDEITVPLKRVISIANKRSNNFISECLFKSVGAHASQSQGNGTNAAQAIIRFLKDYNLYRKGTVFVDGSGLSRSNRVSAEAIVKLLEMIYFDLDKYELYANSLSIAGVDGTLSGRLSGTLAEYNFRGKTGTLNGVVTLSGYIKTASDDDLIVSILFNYSQKSADFYRNIQDDIIRILAEY